MINLDNGPENQSHRTQFLNWLVAFAQTYQLAIKLAYYPRITAHTIRLNDAGAFWRTTGMEIS